MKNRANFACCISGAMLFLSQMSVALAHDAWIEVKDGRIQAVFGHDGKLEAISPAKLKTVSAVDAAGAALAVKTEAGPKSIWIQAGGKPALMTLYYDNGYYTKTAEGTQNLPKNEVPGAISTSHAVKYGKTVFDWTPVATRAQGQPMEIVPLGEQAPVANGKLTVQLLWAGKPLAATKVFAEVQGKELAVVTDEAGKAQLPVTAGVQRLWASVRKEVSNDPRKDVDSVSANLVFQAR